ncbi:MAG: hypothetical protein CMJ18_15125, partial [Phycisphaeraceae bacterium]|nr:hypothetical protein [Phycisphaeraceae bacterium]
LRVTGEAGNEPPVIVSAPRTDARLGNTWYYQASADDPNGDALAFRLDTAPATMSIDPATGLILWDPSPGEFGRNDVVLIVEDGRGGADTQSFAIDVATQADNTAPVIMSEPIFDATAGRPYVYDAVGVDAENDPLTWQLSIHPTGMSIDPDLGTLRWTPTAGHLGPNPVELRVFDTQGAGSVQGFDIFVHSNNLPPVIDTLPLTLGAVGDLYTYALTFALSAGPTGMAIDPVSGLLAWTPVAGEEGVHDVLLSVDDGAGGVTTQGYQMLVTATSSNLPPEITSSPPQLALEGALYQYVVEAIDPDGGSPQYGLSEAPVGMTIDAVSGLVQWTPAPGQVGAPAIVTVTATDTAGAAASQRYAVNVRSGNQGPTFIVEPAFATPAGLPYHVLVTDVNDPDGDPITFRLDARPQGMTIDALGRVSYLPTLDDVGTHPVRIVVIDPFGLGGFFDYDLVVFEDDQAPQVTLRIDENPIGIDAPVRVTVAAVDDVEVARVDLTLDGVPVALDAGGAVTLTFDAIGSHDLVASAFDTTGNRDEALGELRVIDPTDADAPTVSITVPTDGDVIRIPTEVIGTADDDNLVSYLLEIAPANGTFTTIAEDTVSVVDGTLGTLDPTVLPNGPYALRLTATDAGGNVSTTQRTIEVDGALKVGQFSLSYVDLTLPSPGLPVSLIRSYSTLDLGHDEDFGVGWRLGFRDVDLISTVEPSGLEHLGLYNPFRNGTRVVIALPGGGREGFTFRPVDNSLNVLGAVLERFVPAFVPDDGVTSTLTVDRADLKLNDGEFVSLAGSLPYNPASDIFGATYTLQTREGLTYDIDPNAGVVRTVTDRRGNRLTFSQAGIASSSGRNVTFERDAQRRIVALTDPNGQQVRYGYDAANDLVTVTDRDDNVTRFVYDGNHRIVEIIDPLGRQAQRSEYDDEGRLIAQIDAEGNRIEHIHNVTGRREVQKDAEGNEFAYVYNDFGDVTSVTDPLGNTTRLTYDALGNVLTRTDALDHTTTFTYNQRGDRTSETTPLGDVITTTWNPQGDPTSIVDPHGQVTEIAYDRFGNLTTLTDPLGNTITQNYNTHGQLTSRTDPLGNTFLFDYNSFGDLTRETDPMGNVATFTYDGNGNLRTESRDRTLADGSQGTVTTAFEYDDLDRVVRHIDAASAVMRFDYDATGQLTILTDERGNPLTFGQTARGQTDLSTFADGATTSSVYDLNGREVSRTDRHGATVGNAFDEAGRLITRTLAGGGTIDITPDPLGFASEILDSNGGIRRFDRDESGRLVRQQEMTTGAVQQIAYDATNRVTAETDALGRTLQLTYDAAGRVTRHTRADGSILTADYDAAGRITSQTDPFGRTTQFEYDALGRVVSITDAADGITAYEYDEVGNLVRLTEANNAVTRFEYDNMGRRTRRVHPGGASKSWTYDEAGNVATHTDYADRTTTFAYNDVNQLALVTYDDSTTQSYTYDTHGRLETITDDVGTTTYSYDASGRMSGVTNPQGESVAFAYDGFDRQTEVITELGPTTYGYDAAGRLTSVTDPDDGVTLYEYDLASRLVSTTYPNSVETTVDYDLLDRPLTIETRDTNQVLLSSYDYVYDAAGQVTSVTDHQGRSVTYDYDPGPDHAGGVQRSRREHSDDRLHL